MKVRQEKEIYHRQMYVQRQWKAKASKITCMTRTPPLLMPDLWLLLPSNNIYTVLSQF